MNTRFTDAIAQHGNVIVRKMEWRLQSGSVDHTDYVVADARVGATLRDEQGKPLVFKTRKEAIAAMVQRGTGATIQGTRN
jgi:hypothetical protein